MLPRIKGQRDAPLLPMTFAMPVATYDDSMRDN